MQQLLAVHLCNRCPLLFLGAGELYGEFKEIRRALDFAYHVNLNEQRQAWQVLLFLGACPATLCPAAPSCPLPAPTSSSCFMLPPSC